MWVKREPSTRPSVAQSLPLVFALGLCLRYIQSHRGGISDDMNCSLDSLKGCYIGDYIGEAYEGY